MKFGHTIHPLFCHIHGDINMRHFCKYFSCDNPNKKDNFHQLMVMALQNIISIKLVTWFRIWIRIFLVHSSFFTVMLALSAGNGITLGAVNSRWRMRVDRWRHDTCPWRRTNTQHSAPSSVLSAVIAVIMTALDVLTRQSLQLRRVNWWLLRRDVVQKMCMHLSRSDVITSTIIITTLTSSSCCSSSVFARNVH